MPTINLVMNPLTTNPPIVAQRSINSGFRLPQEFGNRVPPKLIKTIQDIIPDEAQERIRSYNEEHQRLILERRDYLNSLKDQLESSAQKTFTDFIQNNPEYFI